MPARPEGVYSDGRGGWYFKITIGRDPLTGRRDQITRRGFRTASEAAKARLQVEAGIDTGRLKPSPAGMTVNELMELYLEGLADDQRLSVKTRHDYRVLADTYVKESIGRLKVRDVTPEAVLSWQRKLRRQRDGEPLAPNTVRLARAPLAGAFKLAVSLGLVALNPVAGAPRPKPRRSTPRHWTPEQARDFLSLMEGDRTYPIWAFLLGSGLRIGELVWLRRARAATPCAASISIPGWQESCDSNVGSRSKRGWPLLSTRPLTSSSPTARASRITRSSCRGRWATSPRSWVCLA